MGDDEGGYVASAAVLRRIFRAFPTAAQRSRIYQAELVPRKVQSSFKCDR